MGSTSHGEHSNSVDEKCQEKCRKDLALGSSLGIDGVHASSLGIDGVHASSFTLGSAVTLTLVAVAYFVRRPRGTKMTDSRRAYGATTVQ